MILNCGWWKDVMLGDFCQMISGSVLVLVRIWILFAWSNLKRVIVLWNLNLKNTYILTCDFASANDKRLYFTTPSSGFYAIGFKWYERLQVVPSASTGTSAGCNGWLTVSVTMVWNQRFNHNHRYCYSCCRSILLIHHVAEITSYCRFPQPCSSLTTGSSWPTCRTSTPTSWCSWTMCARPTPTWKGKYQRSYHSFHP